MDKNETWLKGEKNPNWGGGRHVGYWGYVVLNVAGRQVLEHRYLMEQHLGRTLSKDEIVHHINGDKTDNRLENLTVMTRAEHLIEHWPEIAASRGLAA